MNSQSNNQGLSGVFIGLGVLLIVLSALFLVGQAVGFELGRFGWPFFVIIPGLGLSGVGLAAGDPTGERITPLGAAVTMVGVINLPASCLELFGAPRKELGRYGTEGPPIHEPQPCVTEFGQIESVAGDSFRLGVIFGDRLLDEAKWLAFVAEAAQGRQGYPAPPAFVQETHRPGFGIGRSHFHQSVASEASLFSFVQWSFVGARGHSRCVQATGKVTHH